LKTIAAKLVPTASWVEPTRFKKTRSGTIKIPPPTPTMLATQPIAMAAKNNIPAIKT
jgi:hypothetical protein